MFLHIGRGQKRQKQKNKTKSKFDGNKVRHKTRASEMEKRIGKMKAIIN